MRKQIIAGNWKMNKTPSEAAALAKELAAKCDGADADVVFCVPAIDIIPALEAVKGTSVAIGAQNIHFEESGAYTGESGHTTGTSASTYTSGNSEQTLMARFIIFTIASGCSKSLFTK